MDSVVLKNIRLLDAMRGAEIIREVSRDMNLSADEVVDMARTDSECPADTLYFIEKAVDYQCMMKLTNGLWGI